MQLLTYNDSFNIDWFSPFRWRLMLQNQSIEPIVIFINRTGGSRMKRCIPLIVFLLSTLSLAEVTWDVPIEDFGKITGKVQVYDLEVGDTAKFDPDFGFCTTSDGKLAIDGTTRVGSGNARLKVVPGMKIVIEVDDEKEFLESLIYASAYGECSWWTAHKGKYVRIVDSVNGKNRVSSFGGEK